MEEHVASIFMVKEQAKKKTSVMQVLLPAMYCYVGGLSTDYMALYPRR
jgi:hypothetical protein